jgi:hypothetical protein
LFTPLHDRGYKLYIGLVLTVNTSARYVNKDNGDKMRLYTSISEVKRSLMNVSGVIGVKHISNVTKNGKVYFNKFYQKSLWYVNTSERVKLNAQQYGMLQYCDQPKMTNSSSFFIRMREDTFIDSIELDPIIEMAQSGSVVTTACDAWWGINDKIAFGPSSLASDFFLLPFQYYLGFREVIDNFNPEQLYMHTYQEKGFNLTSTADFVVTKAVTSVKEENTVPQKYDNDIDAQKKKLVCDVRANPFQKYAKKCPKLIRPSYVAPCHY